MISITVSMNLKKPIFKELEIVPYKKENMPISSMRCWNAKMSWELEQMKKLTQIVKTKNFLLENSIQM